MVGSSYVFSGHFSREQTIIANQELCEKIASAANRFVLHAFERLE